MAKYKVLSTKKLEPSLIQKAGDNNIDVSVQEFIYVLPVWNNETRTRILSFPARGLQTAVVTSANAVSILNDYMVADDEARVVAWSFYSLQGKTKTAILTAPFLQKAVVAGEAANASLLADEILKKGIQEIIFFCGDKRRNELPSKLKEAGIIVHEVILYQTIGTPVKMENDFDAVLFFSPSAVQSFFAVNDLNKDTECFAIGPTTSMSIRSFTGNNIVTVISPDPKEMIEDLIEHFKQKSAVG